jgi:hypothetical protein
VGIGGIAQVASNSPSSCLSLWGVLGLQTCTPYPAPLIFISTQIQMHFTLSSYIICI